MCDSGQAGRPRNAVVSLGRAEGAALGRPCHPEPRSPAPRSAPSAPGRAAGVPAHPKTNSLCGVGSRGPLFPPDLGLRPWAVKEKATVASHVRSLPSRSCCRLGGGLGPRPGSPTPTPRPLPRGQSRGPGTYGVPGVHLGPMLGWGPPSPGLPPPAPGLTTAGPGRAQQLSGRFRGAARAGSLPASVPCGLPALGV